ncbi:hypothetical protein CLOP_g985, partial [Closterium sp. NIES-67]
LRICQVFVFIVLYLIYYNTRRFISSTTRPPWQRERERRSARRKRWEQAREGEPALISCHKDKVARNCRKP